LSIVRLTVEFDREEDGRWIADVPQLPGVLVYGRTRKDALAKVQALAFAVLSADVKHGRRDPKTLMQVQFVARAA
jgi:predicted RNase H-like HicB family nuclease